MRLSIGDLHKSSFYGEFPSSPVRFTRLACEVNVGRHKWLVKICSNLVRAPIRVNFQWRKQKKTTNLENFQSQILMGEGGCGKATHLKREIKSAINNGHQFCAGVGLDKENQEKGVGFGKWGGNVLLKKGVRVDMSISGSCSIWMYIFRRLSNYGVNYFFKD